MSVDLQHVCVTAVLYQVCFYNLNHSLFGEFVNYSHENYDSGFESEEDNIFNTIC